MSKLFCFVHLTRGIFVQTIFVASFVVTYTILVTEYRWRQKFYYEYF